ncbi:hypothetical protein ZEAMMB73_Zm00001d019453 [Zea mays]|uniref:Uncharacterized protein n=1 Tax=Zea mays TaxID=4577 RepID=B6TRJ1_MAIZE|nr:hypothetical protein [Zea mays]ONM52944.1 hypothetical protein ZEAMMB73_Zm00001d019453 [Zea mays]
MRSLASRVVCFCMISSLFISAFAASRQPAIFQSDYADDPSPAPTPHRPHAAPIPPGDSRIWMNSHDGGTSTLPRDAATPSASR